MTKFVAQAYCLGITNGNNLWVDAITKETKDVSPAFNKLDNGDIFPILYQRVNYHTIFDVKMEFFHRMDRLVLGRHVTDPPSTITYASIVSMYTVRIALKLTALNVLPVQVADIQNNYITVPVTENIWKVLVPEFGEESGSKTTILRSHYGLNSEEAVIRNHLADLCIILYSYRILLT